MKGLNVKVNIIARVQSPDDSVGGSVRTDLARYTGVDARISNKAQPTILASQGFESTQLHQIILYPDSYPDIETEDMVVPTSGRWTGARFRVMEVQPSSVIDGGPRAHTQLMCKRVRYADDNVAESAFAATAYVPPKTLNSGIDAAAQVIFVDDPQPWAVGDVIQIDNERMMCSIVGSGSSIVIRGFNSIAAPHLAGAAVLRAPGQE